MAAVTSFLSSEGIKVPKQSMQSQLTILAQFNVSSSIDILKCIGKFCVKSRQYGDLAVNAFKEYLAALTFSKMFSLGAG